MALSIMSLGSGGDDTEEVVGGHQVSPLFAHIPDWVEIFSLETGGPRGFFYVPTFDRDKGLENDGMITLV